CLGPHLLSSLLVFGSTLLSMPSVSDYQKPRLRPSALRRQPARFCVGLQIIVLLFLGTLLGCSLLPILCYNDISSGAFAAAYFSAFTTILLSLLGKSSVRRTSIFPNYSIHPLINLIGPISLTCA
ncbi:hypothetical protein B0H14DRAFT_2964242, partial [Mycena olivaceomarginata]